jgi:hypothetical protein
VKKFFIINTENNFWQKKIEIFKKGKVDIFYSQEFAKLCQKTIYKDFSVLCLIAEDNEDIILCPVVKRKFKYKNKIFFDLTSMYNLGGPIENRHNIDLQLFFSKKLNQYCKDNKIINFFIRFHPLLKNFNMKLSKCKKINTGDYITVNLEKLSYPIIQNFEHRHKKSIKKAINSKVEIIISNDEKYLNDFVEIYYNEMKAKNAKKFYFFQKEFFKELKNSKFEYQFFLAIFENKIISCELVLYNNTFCHSYLGATKQKFKNICANHLLKEKILSFFKNKGLKYYLIGGGNEGILKYKIGFSNEKVRENIIGKIYYDKKLNDFLLKEFKNKYKKAEFKNMQYYENYL